MSKLRLRRSTRDRCPPKMTMRTSAEELGISKREGSRAKSGTECRSRRSGCRAPSDLIDGGRLRNHHGRVARAGPVPDHGDASHSSASSSDWRRTPPSPIVSPRNNNRWSLQPAGAGDVVLDEIRGTEDRRSGSRSCPGAGRPAPDESAQTRAPMARSRWPTCGRRRTTTSATTPGPTCTRIRLARASLTGRRSPQTALRNAAGRCSPASA